MLKILWGTEETDGICDVFRYVHKRHPHKRLGDRNRGVWIDLAKAAQKRWSVDILNQNLDRGQEKEVEKLFLEMERIILCKCDIVTVQFVVQLCTLAGDCAMEQNTVRGEVWGETMDNLDDLRL